MGVAPDATDTIFALSTGGLPSGIAVVRLSGPDSHNAVRQIAGVLPEPRQATLALFKDADATPIDRGLVLWFPGPASVTGEDMAEFHIHGSRAVAAKMIAVLAEMPGLRAAEAGEFTRRAVFNEKMDLSAAEGLGDLLDAETEAQRKQALAMAEGGLAAQIHAWSERLLTAEARLEAVLNFSDEGDVDEADEAFALDIARSVAAEIGRALDSPPAERLRDGIRVVLAGPPNAGKSTLLNALVAREAAIVSPIAGTTRDVIEAAVDLGGLPFVFFDTAGLRESDDAIEGEGVRRARDVAERADILLWLGDVSESPDRPGTIAVRTKADTEDAEADERISLSAVTGEGMEALRSLLIETGQAMVPDPNAIALNVRQKAVLREVRELLAGADTGDWVLLSETLRSARTAFGRLTGQGGVEDMLDALFGRFCIGK